MPILAVLVQVSTMIKSAQLTCQTGFWFRLAIVAYLDRYDLGFVYCKIKI